MDLHIGNMKSINSSALKVACGPPDMEEKSGKF
jgi:hypothetical protein